ncbi:hypothetical protein B9Z19DRAFT_508638 [Tuber borchii]|uniref:Uncharacterized protein n=1 Tax=Tuber borchii TaxID=42251 RepID=A0A2T6ZEB4_TUBBO|nr:hypothetical protein B9Z19DRAFT_508638 [Tuber borchii]
MEPPQPEQRSYMRLSLGEGGADEVLLSSMRLPFPSARSLEEIARNGSSCSIPRLDWREQTKEIWIEQTVKDKGALVGNSVIPGPSITACLIVSLSPSLRAPKAEKGWRRPEDFLVLSLGIGSVRCSERRAIGPCRKKTMEVPAGAECSNC